MAFDPNLYALQIELDLNATEAFKTLDQLDDRLLGIEERMSQAMGATMSEVVDLTGQLNAQLEMTSTLVGDAGISYGNQIDQLAETVEKTKEITDDIERRRDFEDEMKEVIEERNDLAEIYQFMNEKIVELFGAQAVGASDVNGLIDEMAEAMGLSSEMADRLKVLLNEAGFSTATLNNNFRNFIRTIQEGTNALYDSAKAIAEMTQMSELFVTANFRAYGSQHELMQEVTRTSAEFGVFRESAAEAFQELMGIRVPAEELRAYAGEVAQTARVTGTGIRELSEYTRVMSGVGLELGELQFLFGTAAAAQRQFGLTTAEVTDMLTSQLEKTAELTRVLGDDFPRQLMLARAQMQGMIKEAGTSQAAMTGLNDIITATGAEALQFSAMYGEMFQEDRFGAVTQQFGEFGMRLYEASQDATMTKEDMIALQIELGALAEAYGGNYEMVETYAKMIDETGGTMEGLQAHLEQQQAELLAAQERYDEFNKSMNTLNASVKKLGDAFFALAMPFINFVARGMIPIIDTMAFLVDSVVTVIEFIGDLYSSIESLFPPLAWLRQALEIVVAGIIMFGGALVAVVAIGGSILSLIGAIGGAFGSLGGIFGGLVTRFTGGLSTLGQMFVSFMGTIGKGIAALFKPLQSLTGPILAVGAALLMAGTGAYMFAQGAVLLAQQGTAAIGAVVGLTVAIGVLGLVLVGLGTLAMPVVPGLLAVGAALLMMGAAAMMVGVGIGLAAMGIAQLIEAIPDDIATRLGGLALGLGALALTAYFVTPGLVLLGYGLAAIAIPLAMAGAGLYVLAMGLQQLQTIQLPTELGAQFIVFAASLAIGAYMLSAVLIPLAIAGVGLYLFAQGLQQLSGFEMPDIGGKLILLAGELAIGAFLLSFVMTPLILAGIGLYLFAQGLQQMEGIEIGSFGGKLIALAGEMAIGALLLAPIALSLITAGIGIYLFAQGLQELDGIEIGGFGGKLIGLAFEMMIGAALLGPVATALMWAGAGIYVFAQGLQQLQDMELGNVGEEIFITSVYLGMAAVILGPASIALMVASFYVAAAGIAISAAGMSLMVGSFFLGFAVSALTNSISGLDEAADTMATFAAAAAAFAELSFASLREAVYDLSFVSNNMVNSIESFETAAARLNDTELEADDLAASITDAAAALDGAVKSLAGPAQSLKVQIDDIADQVERLVNAEAQVREIGGEIADAVKQPREEAEQPNEMRAVEKVTDAVNALVEVKQDNTEMVELLGRLVELMEEQNKNAAERKGFFQNEGGMQPDGEKFEDAGVKI